MAIASPSTILRIALSYVPSSSRGGLARRLMLRANRERDAKRFQVAAALYEEALLLGPADPRIRANYAHLHSEMGDAAGAERHFTTAVALAPGNPELAVQIGHFYRDQGRSAEAEHAYGRAAALKAGRKVVAQQPAQAEPSDTNAAESYRPGVQLVPELLPASEPAAARPAKGFHVRRLGATRVLTSASFSRVLRGVEAIHGFCIGSGGPAEFTMSIDGDVVHREPLTPIPLSPRSGPAKYVFNIWCDVSGRTPGICEVELRFVERGARNYSYRATLTLLPPLSEPDALDSDAVVAPMQERAGSPDDQINCRPSVIRPAQRSVLAREPCSILVQRADQLGDLVCSVPALRRLREGFPHAHLVLLVTHANADFARTLGMIDEVVACDFVDDALDGRRVMSASDQVGLAATLAAHAFDVAIDLGEGLGSRPLLLLSDAPFLYGFRDRDTPWLSAGLDLNAHDPANYREVIAPSRKMLALVEGLIVAAHGAAEVIRRPDLPRDGLERFGIGTADDYVVLHTGARLQYSRWPHYGALAQMLLEKTELKVVVLGEDPIDHPPTSSRLIVITERTAFDDFDALLSHAKAFVGNDSGPKHLAALRGTPVVSIHMARLAWNEWGQEQTGSIISRRVPCAGCGIGRNGEECGKAFACIRLISVDEVFDEMLRLMA